jgi:YfiH family protein
MHVGTHVGTDARRIQFADEVFLEVATATGLALFGYGPAHGPGASSERVTRLLDITGFPFPELHWGGQVHGNSCAFVTGAPDPGGHFHPATDALATQRAGVGVGVWTADCVPVLLANERFVAAVHCGWRGLAAGILPGVVGALEVHFGVLPSRIEALIGPAVGPCHYEVGEEVLRGLARHGLGQSLWAQGRRVDLRAFAVAQLRALGLAPEATHLVGGCTACDANLASYRRDGALAGRQITLIGLPRPGRDGAL